MVVAGISLIAWIFWAAGWPAIEANLSAIGPWFFALSALYCLAELAFALGWWVLIDPESRHGKFLRLFGVYLAGYSVNYLVPSANFAGEPVKADLSRDTLGLGDAVASITVHKHTELLAQWVFLAAGMVVCLTQFDLSTPVKVTAAVFIGGLGVGLILATMGLRKGTFLPILHRLAKWKRFTTRLTSYQPLAEALDAKIQPFYSRKQSGLLGASAAWCFVGWCGGLLETYLVLRLLAPTEGWTTAVAVETLAMILNSLLVFVPGRVGTAEGVRVGVFMVLGLPAAQGAAYGLVRRGRELIWITPGLVVLLKRYGARLSRLGLSDSPS
jgi:glycosyltransferase 2 family protein